MLNTTTQDSNPNSENLANHKEKSSFKESVYLVFNGVSNSILVTLGVGLLLTSINNFVHWQALGQMGTIAQLLMAPAIGAAVASQLKTNTLVLFSSMIAATSIGSIVALGFATVTTPALVWLSAFTAQSMKVNPVIGSMAIAVLWGLFLLIPASSAALAIAIMLDLVSAGAALMGTTVQFVTYTVMSYQENQPGTNIAQLFVTPKIQFGNITKNAWIMLPGMISVILAGVIGTNVFHFSVPYTIAGLGLNSLIATIAILTSNFNNFLIFFGIGVLMPAAIGIVCGKSLRATKRIKKGDMKVDLV